MNVIFLLFQQKKILAIFVFKERSFPQKKALNKNASPFPCLHLPLYFCPDICDRKP